MADGSEPTILALSPSAEAVAYTVTEGARLLDYGVRLFEVDEEERLVSEEVVAAAEAAMDHFTPDVLAVPRVTPDGSYERSQRNLLSDRIRAVAVRRDLKIYRATQSAVRKMVTGNPRASGAQLSETLAVHYPELRTLTQNQIQQSEESLLNLVDNLGLALAGARASTGPKF